MKRLLIIILKNLHKLPFFTFKMYYMAANQEKYTLAEKSVIPIYLTEHIVKSGRVNIESQGHENLPEEDGYILYPNHQGVFDGFAIEYACRVPFFPVLKKELMKIPYVYRLFLCMEALSMDREDVKQSIRIIQETTRRVKAGKNALIFPEGTRSRNGNHVGTFKAGSFKAATKAKAPIVPIALVDSYIPFDKGSIKPVTVQVHILKPLMYEDYKGMKTSEIAKLVQGRIEACIAENEKRDEE